ncbi:MAG: Ig-like domain-containing protein, partial [Psychrosphaera sp.]|nr:Ig-like domain-containing protein [Psychrosphaera sp.]
FDLQRTVQSFVLPITPELLGETLALRARVVDYHNLESLSEVIRVAVKSDQAPTIAISHPVEGSSWVAGLPIELRAQASDDVAIAAVEFYVNEHLVGSDLRAPYNLPYQTTIITGTEQTLSIYAQVIDSQGNSAKSQTVTVTLGKDEERPVLNIVSPQVTRVEGQLSLSEVVENSEMVFKVAGFDNVGVTALSLSGIRKEGARYVLTGNSDDKVSGDDFAPQQIPGGINAYSALKIVSIPLFSNLSNTEYDSYTVVATAADAVGNISTAEQVIAVSKDLIPVVEEVNFEQSVYFAQNLVKFDVFATDDRGVEALTVEYFKAGDNQPFATQVQDKTQGLVTAKALSAKFNVNLAAYDISNAEQIITVKVSAQDNNQLLSVVFETSFAIKADVKGPVAALNTPIIGSTIYNAQVETISWAVKDNSFIKKIQLLNQDVVIAEVSPTAKFLSNGSVQYTVNESTTDLHLTLITTDIYDNQSINDWHFNVANDQPPTVNLRAPAPGSRLIEGEAFTLSANVGDDKQVTQAEFFIRIKDGETLFSKVFDSAEVNAAIESGSFLSVGMRVPNKPAVGEVEIGVRATDSSNLFSEALLEMDILNDEEAPRISRLKPDTDFSILPGDSFEFSGEANDNLYINQIEAYLIDQDDVQTLLEFQVLARDDRLETLTIPDPTTLGEVIIGERYYSDFSGSIRISQDYINRMGETFKLVFKASDNGVNTRVTSSVNLTIAFDEQPPTIVVQQPLAQLVERQVLPIVIDINDNINIDSFKVYMNDAPTVILAEKSGISQKRVQLNSAYLERELILDLNQYAPIPESGKIITLVVEATDSAGNSSRITHNITIKPDQLPTIALSALSPAQWLKGGAGYHTFDLSDDFVNNEAVVKFMPAYSSLSAITKAGEPRLVTANILPTTEYDTDAQLFSEFAYPEAGSINGELLLADIPYVTVDAGKLKLFGLTDSADANSRLKLDFGSDIITRYRVRAYSDNRCSVLQSDTLVTDPQGVELAAFFGAHTVALIIEPEFESVTGGPLPDFIKQIRVDVGSQNGKGSYNSQSIDRSIAVESIKVALVLADEGADSQGKALLMAGSLRTFSGATNGSSLVTNIGARLPLMAEPWLNEV